MLKGRNRISNVNWYDLHERTEFVNTRQEHIHIKIFDVLVKHFHLFVKAVLDESVLLT